MKPFPTRFEIYTDDDPEAMAAKVSVMDAEMCRVKIHAVVSADTWPELSLQIQQALEMVVEGVIATTPKGGAK